MKTSDFVIEYYNKRTALNNEINRMSSKKYEEYYNFITNLYLISRDYFLFTREQYKPVLESLDNYNFSKVIDTEEYITVPQIIRNIHTLQEEMFDETLFLKSLFKDYENRLTLVKDTADEVNILYDKWEKWWEIEWITEDLIELFIEDINITNPNELRFKVSPPEVKDNPNAEYIIMLSGKGEIEQLIKFMTSDGKIFVDKELKKFITADPPIPGTVDSEIYIDSENISIDGDEIVVNLFDVKEGEYEIFITVKSDGYKTTQAVTPYTKS